MSSMEMVLPLNPKQRALALIRWQCHVGVVVSLFCFFYGFEVAYSVLLGCIVVVLPSYWFAYRLFLSWRLASAKQILLRFYLGELFKMIFSGFLAIFFVKCMAVNAIALIVGMLVAYTTYMVMAPRVMQDKQRGTG